MQNKHKIRFIRIIVLILFFVSAFLHIVDTPWPYADGELKSDCIAAGQFQIARNYLRYGYIKTKCLQILNPQESKPENWVFYFNHPATFPLLQSLVFRVFNPTFVCAKILPGIAYVLQIIFLYKLTRILYGKITALISLGVYSLFQMTLLFGAYPNYEPFCLLFILIFLERCAKKKYFQATVFLGLGGLFDYVALYPGPFMALILLLNRKGKNTIQLAKAVKIMVAWGIISICVLAVPFIHASLAPKYSGFLNYIKGLFSSDTQLFVRATDFTWLNFLESQLEYFIKGYGIIAFIVSIIGFILIRWNRILLVIVSVSLFHILVFRFHAHVHFFWGIYMAPAIAVSFGFLATKIIMSSKSKRIIALGLALTLVAGAEGSARFILRRSCVDPSKPKKWALVLNSSLPKESVAILVGKNLPPFWSVEFFTNNISVKESPLLSSFDFKRIALLLKKYGLHKRKIYAVANEKDMKEIGKTFNVNYLEKAREFFEKGIRKGIYLGKSKFKSPYPVLHFWDLTESFRQYF